MTIELGKSGKEELGRVLYPPSRKSNGDESTTDRPGNVRYKIKNLRIPGCQVLKKFYHPPEKRACDNRCYVGSPPPALLQ